MRWVECAEVDTDFFFVCLLIAAEKRLEGEAHDLSNTSSFLLAIFFFILLGSHAKS